jgi:hypothetical protein
MPPAPLWFPDAGRMLLNFPGFGEGNAREACKSAISPASLLVQAGRQTLKLPAIAERDRRAHRDRPQLVQPVTPIDAIFRSELTGGSGHAPSVTAMRSIYLVLK